MSEALENPFDDQPLVMQSPEEIHAHFDELRARLRTIIGERAIDDQPEIEPDIEQRELHIVPSEDTPEQPQPSPRRKKSDQVMGLDTTAVGPSESSLSQIPQKPPAPPVPPQKPYRLADQYKGHVPGHVHGRIIPPQPGVLLANPSRGEVTEVVKDIIVSGRMIQANLGDIHANPRARVSPELRQRLEQAWPSLNALQRRVTVLKACYGLKDSEVARLTRITPAMVGFVREAMRKDLKYHLFEMPTDEDTPTRTSMHTGEQVPVRPLIKSSETTRQISASNATLSWETIGSIEPSSNTLARDSRITGFTFGAAKVAVNGSDYKPTPSRDQTAILASLGYSNAEIAAELLLSVDTIKTHMRAYFRRNNLTNRSQLAGHMLESGYYQVNEYGEPLKASPAQARILPMIAKGYTNEEIGDETGLHTDTIKTHVRSVIKNNGFRSREQVGLAYLLSQRPESAEQTELLDQPA